VEEGRSYDACIVLERAGLLPTPERHVDAGEQHEREQERQEADPAHDQQPDSKADYEGYQPKRGVHLYSSHREGRSACT
jgi:hypothetical protein